MHRIAIFLPDFPVLAGGVERVMRNLAYELSKLAQIDLVIATGRLEHTVGLSDRIHLHQVGARRTATALPGLIRFLRSERPDVLISAKDHANVLAVMASMAARTHTRVVLTVHSSPPMSGPHRSGLSGRLLPSAMRILYPQADLVVGVSEGIASSLVKHFCVAREKVVALPNPIIDDRLLSATRSPVPHPWLSGLIPVVLSVARLSPEKDIALLIDAVAAVRRVRSIRLIVVGDGPERDMLMRRAQRRGIADEIDFVGFVSDPSPFIAHCSVLALTSRFEGLPTVLVEALALGRQVVSTDCPTGPRELLDSGRLGRLVPVGDVSALAEALIAAIEEPLPTPALEDLARYRVENASALFAEYLTSLLPPP